MKDFAGRRFGELVTVKQEHKGRKYYYWLCQCDCGNMALISRGRLMDGVATSCGHYRNTQNRLWSSRSYTTWSDMVRRCHNKDHHQYKDYGGRGIFVCEEWHDFKVFYKDMGERPIGSSIDRIDNNKGYYKGNCRWADRKTQNNNTRQNRFITCFGKTKTLQQWSDETGINAETISSRIKRNNWSLEKALSTPTRPFKK